MEYELFISREVIIFHLITKKIKIICFVFRTIFRLLKTYKKGTLERKKH